MICIYDYVYNCILPTHMCMYVERKSTQSYLLDIWYVCRERTYTILFIIYMHAQVYLERLDLWHETFIHMYSRDVCIHLCAMMVHVCIHMYGMIHLLLSHSCV